MSEEIKKEFHYFFLTDYEKEEAFLRQKHREGWALQRIAPFGFYFFRRCAPENMVYRMDFQTQKQPEQSPYLQMFQDYGWDYVTDCNSFQIFRKPADRQNPRDDEIFSDDESRLDMMKRMFLYVETTDQLFSTHRASKCRNSIIISCIWRLLLTVICCYLITVLCFVL